MDDAVLKPKRRDDVVIDEANGGIRIVFNPATGNYFRMGIREAAFLETLDGKLTLPELAEAHSQFKAEQVAFLVEWFDQTALLEPSGAEDTSVAEKKKKKKGFKQLLSSDQWRFVIGNPDRMLTRHRGLIDGLFERPALLAYALMVAAPMLLLVFVPSFAIAAKSQFRFDMPFADWLAIYILMVLTLIGHELAHAVTCKHFGGQVTKIGVMLTYLHPAAFCDVSAVWRLRKRSQQVLVLAAGMLLQILLLAVALTAWMLTGQSFLAQYAMISGVLVILNLFPFVKLDGYWMLVYITGVANLREEGVKAVAALVSRRWRWANFKGDKHLILLFGLIQAVAIPGFWVLGLVGAYGVLQRNVSVLAVPVTAMLAFFVAARFLMGGQRFVRLVRQTA